MSRRAWTADEDETLRVNYPRFPAFLIAYLLDRGVGSVHGRAHVLGVAKIEGFHRQWHTPLWQTYDHPKQVAHRFKPGQIPANKGLRRPGFAPGRMANTQFRRGERRGKAAGLWKPIGTERISKDGYLERKINDDLPLQRRWKTVHRIVWEQANGPIPAGHLVVFRKGLKTCQRELITVDRLELISCRENMSRNSVHNYPMPIVRAIQMRGALNRVIHRVQRENRP